MGFMHRGRVGSAGFGWGWSPLLVIGFPFHKVRAYDCVIPVFIACKRSDRRLAFVVVDVSAPVEDHYFLVFAARARRVPHEQDVEKRFAWVDPALDVLRFTMKFTDAEKNTVHSFVFHRSHHRHPGREHHEVSESVLRKFGANDRVVLYITPEFNHVATDVRDVTFTEPMAEKLEFPTIYYGHEDPYPYFKGKRTRKWWRTCCSLAA
jgi:hypothetical protein